MEHAVKVRSYKVPAEALFNEISAGSVFVLELMAPQSRQTTGVYGEAMNLHKAVTGAPYKFTTGIDSC